MDYISLFSSLSAGLNNEQAAKDLNHLFCHVCKTNLAQLKANNPEITPDQELMLAKAWQEYGQGKPLAYILGHVPFLDFELNVTPDVLIPRPETEYFASLIQPQLAISNKVDVLEVGVGSGCIGIGVCRSIYNSRYTGIELSPSAYGIAKNNMEATLGITFATEGSGKTYCKGVNEITLINIGLDEFILKTNPALVRFTHIISNPPYIKTGDIGQLDTSVKDYEPVVALDGGQDGLTVYRQIFQLAARHPSLPQVYLEASPELMVPLQKLALETGYQNVEVKVDQFGRERFLFCS